MPAPCWAPAALGAQRRGGAEQFVFVGLAGPEGFERGLEFPARPDARVAEVGGDTHRVCTPPPVRPARRKGWRRRPRPAFGEVREVAGAGRSPGSRVPAAGPPSRAGVSPAQWPAPLCAGRMGRQLAADSCWGSHRLAGRGGPRTAFPFHPLARDRRDISISLCCRGGKPQRAAEEARHGRSTMAAPSCPALAEAVHGRHLPAAPTGGTGCPRKNGMPEGEQQAHGHRPHLARSSPISTSRRALSCPCAAWRRSGWSKAAASSATAT